MVDNLGTSLYGGDTPGESIKPDFEKSGGGAADKLSKAENAAAGVAKAALAAKGGGAGAAGGTGAGGVSGIGGAKNAAKDGLKSGTEKAEANEQNPKGLYNKDGEKQSENEDDKSLKMSKGMKNVMKAAAPMLILGLFMLIVPLILIGMPILIIGTIDYNLMKILGYIDILGILEEEGTHITAEFMTDGEFPSEYASALANNGIDVGQVLANGDFVRTNSYIADAGTRDDLVAAASGFSYISDDEGELAMLYNGNIIHADEFVVAVESDPVLYAAYSGAADLDTKYYYGDDVNSVYKEFNLSRGNFNNWESTGDYAKDAENYNSIVKDILGSSSAVEVGGVLDNAGGIGNDEDGGTFLENVPESAIDFINVVADNTKEYISKWENVVCGAAGSFFKKLGDLCYNIASTSADIADSAAQRGTQLINNVVSAVEAFKSAVAFIAIEEPIQRARVDGDGPVHHAMDSLTHGKEVSYQDVNSGETKTTDLSILETKNFKATVGNSDYDPAEAQNFGRDRVMKVTGNNSQKAINGTTIATNGQRNSSPVVRNGDLDASDTDSLYAAEETLSLTLDKDDAELFQSVVGGNRAIEGGSFLSNSINLQVVGALPSDDGAIQAYNKEVEKTTARREEAERATKSPFDISSPNTFFGSIVHNIGMAVIRNYGSGMTALSAATSAGDMTSRAVANLTGSATALNSDDKFTTMNGLGCDTIGTVGVKGDLYCNSHNTPSTEYIHYTFDDFKNSEIGEDINDDGTIKDNTEFSLFWATGMDRYSTVGIKNTDVCEKYNDYLEQTDTSLLSKLKRTIGKIVNWFGSATEIYDPCRVEEDDEGNIKNETEQKKLDIYTGKTFTFSSELSDEQLKKNKLYSGYMLYNEVKSLLSGEKSAVSVIREDYYAKHPKDNSTAGIIARHAGVSKEEAEIALAYIDYQTMIANYNPAGRFDFTAPVVFVEKPILEKQSDDVALNLYAWYSKETEYSDLRTRNFVV